MNPINLMIAAGIVVGVGTVVQEKQFSVQAAAGAAFAALALSIMANVDERLATLFAAGILLTALYKYAIPITEKMGLGK